jgi:hypothetical protein
MRIVHHKTQQKMTNGSNVTQNSTKHNALKIYLVGENIFRILLLQPTCQRVFNRDMLLNVPLIADWHAITQRREHHIHENLMRENQKRRGFDYAPQKWVLKKK